MKSLIILFALLQGFMANPNIEVESPMHEFHLSNTIVNYNSEEKAIQITMRIFIDDLELALQGIGHDSLKLCTSKEKQSAEQHVFEYIHIPAFDYSTIRHSTEWDYKNEFFSNRFSR